jgi:hypothetical protein
MKTILFLKIAAISTLAFYSCTKKSNSGPTQSQWTINGITYKADTTSFTYDPSSTNSHSPYLLESIDPLGNYLLIYFNTKPLYINYNTLANHPNINPNQDSTCFVYIGAQGIGYYTTENPVNKVNLTVTNGKVKASFTNIEVVIDNNNNPQTATVSGTIIQQ